MYYIFTFLFLVFLSSCSLLEKQEPDAIKKTDNTIAYNQDLEDTLPTTEIQKSIPDKIEKAPLETKQVFDENSNIWDRIPSLYQIPYSENSLSDSSKKRILIEKNWYLNHPKYLYRVSERAQPYLYLIVEQIKQRNLPAELALLPIVESAFQPHAYSPGRAAGLWQFIPGTGKYFGLKQNWWYDGRRDIYAATNAALDYLEQLNKQFDNDWLLALASYNAGAGTVKKAIRKNKRLHKGTSYWELPLPKETRSYIPKLLALAQIIKELKTNEIKLLAIKNQPFLELVDCESHIDLAVASELAGISIDDLYKYNSGFNQWATDPEGPHHLLLPISAVEKFKKNLAAIDKNKLIRWSKYKIKQGDSLSQIARHHGVTVRALKTSNRLKNSNIRAGKYLVIPLASKGKHYYNSEVNKQRDKIIAKINAKRRMSYKVKRGDSLWTISRKYRISYKKLAKANGISPLSTLSIGQKLVIWSTPTYKMSKTVKRLPAKHRKSNIIRYKVKKGDSLYTIAKRHKVSINQLVKWNNISKNKYLKLGQKLVIYRKS